VDLPGVLFPVGGDTIRLTFPARHLTVRNLDDLHDFRGNFRGNFRGKESQGGATVASSDPRGRGRPRPGRALWIIMLPGQSFPYTRVGEHWECDSLTEESVRNSKTFERRLLRGKEFEKASGL